MRLLTYSFKLLQMAKYYTLQLLRCHLSFPFQSLGYCAYGVGLEAYQCKNALRPRMQLEERRLPDHRGCGLGLDFASADAGTPSAVGMAPPA